MFFHMLSSRSIRQNRHLRRLRLCVFIWVVFSQFPIPLVHAHGFDVLAQPWLTEHLRHDHGSAINDGVDDHQSAPLHWHLLLPWDNPTEEQSDDAPNSSPLGMWGADGFATLDRSQSEFTGRSLGLIQVAICDRSVIALARPHRPAAANSCTTAFWQSFIGVPVCALLGVSLR